MRFYAIRDRAGSAVGQFYVDLYARPSKRGGAWMDDAITRRRKDGRVQAPVAYLNCNFSAPVGGKPALFTHDEVSTLFHEFGHGLHHLLTRVDYLGRVRHQRRRVGRGRAALASSWRTSAGNGTCSRR